MTAPTPEPTPALYDVIVSASWPDGQHDGFPTRKVAQMIADAIEASPWLSAHDAQVAEKAWDEGFETARRWNSAPMCRNPYRKAAPHA